MHRSDSSRPDTSTFSIRTFLLPRTIISAATVAAVAVAASLAAAAPAGATLRFCKVVPGGHVCAWAIEQCMTETSGDVLIIGDEGDYFLDTYGRLWTCHNGEWGVSFTGKPGTIQAPVPGSTLPPPTLPSQCAPGVICPSPGPRRP
jgi:hypothetical protein